MRVYPVWDRQASVSPAQYAPTQPHKMLEFSWESEEYRIVWFQVREDKAEFVQQQVDGIWRMMWKIFIDNQTPESPQSL